MKATERLMNVLLILRNTVLSKASGMLRITERRDAEAEASNKRASVTRELWAKGCFMARQRSALIKATWNSEASTTQLPAALGKTCNAHGQPEVSICKKVMVNAMKTG